MGTDSLGRCREPRRLRRAPVAAGRRVGPVIAVGIGLAIGLARGYVRALEASCALMDGLMAIPAIPACDRRRLVASARAGRGHRGDRHPKFRASSAWCGSIVLSVREEPYVEAAIAVGTPTLTW